MYPISAITKLIAGSVMKNVCWLSVAAISLTSYLPESQAQTSPYFLTPQVITSQDPSLAVISIDNDGNAVGNSVEGPTYWPSGISVGTTLPNSGGMKTADLFNSDGQAIGTGTGTIVTWHAKTGTTQLPLPTAGTIDAQDDAGDIAGTYSNGVFDSNSEQIEQPPFLMRDGKL